MGSSHVEKMVTQAENDSSLRFNFVAGGDGDEMRLVASTPVPEEFVLPEDIPVFDLMSDEPLPQLSDTMNPPTTAPLPAREKVKGDSSAVAAPSHTPSGEFWVEGDVIMCGCPDCRAPMTVRLWLMIADCWRCGTSIELTEEQEREIRRLLEKREEAKHRVAPAAAVAPAKPAATPTRPREVERPKATVPSDKKAAESVPVKAPPTERARTKERAKTLPKAPTKPEAKQAQPTPPPPPRFKGEPSTDANKAPARPAQPPRPQPRQAASAGLATGARGRIRRMAKAGGVTVWISELLKVTPAWLVSAVFHFVALTVLALFSISDEEDANLITLSSSVSTDVREGGEIQVLDPKNEVQFDLPLPATVDLNDEQVRDAVIKADQDARELRIDPDSEQHELPDLQRVKSVLSNPNAPRDRALVARDPRLRVEIVKKEGGTTLTEAAVARGLRWLAEHQNPDGSWSLHAFDKPHQCTCGGRGQHLGQPNNSAATSLALLPFLGAGQTHRTGRYQDTVARGLRWLIQNQSPEGYLRGGPNDNPQMYAHGQGTIVLCEAFAMEGDEELRVPAQKAVDFVAGAQYIDGGWRYQPAQLTTRQQVGDMSVVGWQLMALQSARTAGLTVPDETLVLAGRFLDLVSDPTLERQVDGLIQRQENVIGQSGSVASSGQQRLLADFEQLVVQEVLDSDTAIACRQQMMRANQRLSAGNDGSETQEAQYAALLHLREIKEHVRGARYVYQPNHRNSMITMTGEALLCRMYLGWTMDQKGLLLGANWLATNHLPAKTNPNLYYWYYATQSMHHVGGPAWERWNLQMRDILVQMQETKGHERGSWSPNFRDPDTGGVYKDAWGSQGGRIYATALATCTLEVYYRHLPIFKQLELK